MYLILYLPGNTSDIPQLQAFAHFSVTLLLTQRIWHWNFSGAEQSSRILNQSKFIYLNIISISVKSFKKVQTRTSAQTYRDLESYVKMAKTKVSKLDQGFYFKGKQAVNRVSGLSLKTAFLKFEL